MSRAILALTAILVSGCGGSSGDPTSGNGGGGAGIQSALQGTWREPCTASAGTSFTSDVAISGLAFNVTPYSYASNTTCSGTGVSQSTGSGTLVIGPAVATNLGVTPVTAYQLDIVITSGTEYTLVYIDTVATPNRMYIGDAVSGANDGSTPAKRPTALGAAFLVKL